MFTLKRVSALAGTALMLVVLAACSGQAADEVASPSVTVSPTASARATATGSPTVAASPSQTAPTPAIPAGTSSWRVPSGSDATAAVLVRNGNRVCWVIAEYEGVGFTGTSTATATGDQLVGVDWSLEESPASYLVTATADGLSIQRTNPIPATNLWTPVMQAQTSELIASHIPGSDGAALYLQLRDSAQTNCA